MLTFTVRDLLWLTLVAALISGWFLDRSVKRIEQDERDTRILNALEECARANVIKDFTIETLAKRELAAEKQKLMELIKGKHQFKDLMPAEPGEWLEKGRPTPR
jgi:hypothetical protein